jgi:glycosyltransferase involved in cell wall biosynthesis
MSDETRVAVIMPAYNAERYLLQAASSVLEQTVRELQLVIVDDGSSDNTLAVARSIDDDRVRVLTVSNGGPARARNTGVAAAVPAPYIAFQDADDVWDREKLETQLRFIEEHAELVAVGSWMRYISPGGKRLGRTGGVLDAHALRQVAAGRHFPFPTPSILVRRSAFIRLNGFDESFRYGSEDLDFCARLAQLGPLQCVPQTLGSVRIHAQSAMARDRWRILLAARFVERRMAGGDLETNGTLEEFMVSYRPDWSERRANWKQLLYRAAAVHHAEGNRVRALGYGTASMIVAPVYTFKRLVRQKRSLLDPLRDPGKYGRTG